MNILENIVNAFQVIILNKMRASLSMLGIIIGVASVIILISIGEGTSQSIISRVQSLGTNLITVSPGGQQSSNARTSSLGGGNTNVLTLDHVNLIQEQVPYISSIAPIVRTSKQVIYGKNNTSTTIYGTTYTYPSVNNYAVEYGQFITQDNDDKSDKVAVLGATVASTLFSGDNPIGKDIIIGDRIFTVIGTLASKGSQGFNNQDNIIIIPLSTAQKILVGNEYLSSIAISASDSEQMTLVKNTIEAVLLKALNIKNSSDATFTVSNQADSLSTISEISSTMTMFLGGIAAISLIVGGIGVMNIMLVSVTERTREIGIRKALGATKGDILGQFLVEALVLSALGGAIGIGISYLVIFIIQKLNLMTVSLSINSVFLSSGFSLGIGIVFGILPAYKAGNLKPIDALRFE